MSYSFQFGWIIVTAAAAASGCASRDRQIDCDSHLVPINAPAPRPHTEELRRSDRTSQAPAAEHQQ